MQYVSLIPLVGIPEIDDLSEGLFELLCEGFLFSPFFSSF